MLLNIHFFDTTMQLVKTKWCSIYGGYNQIFDYMYGTGHATEYWDLMAQKNITSNLLRHFNRQVYEMVDMFMKTCPTLNPPHVKDTMAHDDHVYDPSFGLMGLGWDVNGNPANPIPTIKELQHVMDIGPRHPYVLPRAITIECINQISLVQTTISLQPSSCTLSPLGTRIKERFITQWEVFK